MTDKPQPMGEMPDEILLKQLANIAWHIRVNGFDQGCEDWMIENAQRLEFLYTRTQPDQPSDESRALEKEEREHEQTIIERDCYHEWADMLAEGIADYFGYNVGEHSNLNNPWKEAHEMIVVATVQKENEAAQKPAAAVDLETLLHNVHCEINNEPNGTVWQIETHTVISATIDYLAAHYDFTPKQPRGGA